MIHRLFEIFSFRPSRTESEKFNLLELSCCHREVPIAACLYLCTYLNHFYNTFDVVHCSYRQHCRMYFCRFRDFRRMVCSVWLLYVRFCRVVRSHFDRRKIATSLKGWAFYCFRKIGTAVCNIVKFEFVYKICIVSEKYSNDIDRMILVFHTHQREPIYIMTDTYVSWHGKYLQKSRLL